MATYRTLCQCFVVNGIVEANTILSDAVSAPPNSVGIPTNWVPPSGAVEPLDADAQQKYWNAGPGAAGQAVQGLTLGPSGLWSAFAGPVAPPQVYWVKVSRDTYQLKGTNMPYYTGAGG
jgi:hypothetical protein